MASQRTSSCPRERWSSTSARWHRSCSRSVHERVASSLLCRDASRLYVVAAGNKIPSPGNNWYAGLGRANGADTGGLAYWSFADGVWRTVEPVTGANQLRRVGQVYAHTFDASGLLWLGGSWQATGSAMANNFIAYDAAGERGIAPLVHSFATRMPPPTHRCCATCVMQRTRGWPPTAPSASLDWRLSPRTPQPCALSSFRRSPAAMPGSDCSRPARPRLTAMSACRSALAKTISSHMTPPALPTQSKPAAQSVSRGRGRAAAVMQHTCWASTAPWPVLPLQSNTIATGGPARRPPPVLPQRLRARRRRARLPRRPRVPASVHR